jgi:type IV secretion system protein VirD4
MSKRNTLVGPQLQRGRTDFNLDWKRLIAFLAVIVLGSIVATQVLANSYRFHPALGFNLFHIYPPWSYFVWAHQWEQANNHTLFAQAFGLGVAGHAGRIIRSAIGCCAQEFQGESLSSRISPLAGPFRHQGSRPFG